MADGEVKDEYKEVSLTDAQKIEPDYEVGEEVSERIDFAKFGRRAILNLRQTLAAKVLELEHDSLYNKYKDRVGQVISSEVYQVWKREVLLVDDENNETAAAEDGADTERQLPQGRHHPCRHPARGQHQQQSEDHPLAHGARLPGASAGGRGARDCRRPDRHQERGTHAGRPRQDCRGELRRSHRPGGACVGVHGSRVHGIVKELGGENIDVISWTANTKLFIQRALSPARVSSLTIDEENKKAEVYLKPEEVSLAIGRSGLNIKLASMLTGYTIDVFRELDESQAEEDIYLDEFSDEIDQWVIEAIKKIGLDTARQVLNAPREMLIEKADLEEETVDNVIKVLRAEFES